MKYLVKNKTTGHETLCEKVEMCGFEYYISDGKILFDEYYIYCNQISRRARKNPNAEYPYPEYRKVIATNNKSFDLPQVVDENFELWVEYREKRLSTMGNSQHWDMDGSKTSFLNGYQKAKETFQFTKEDMVELIQSLKDYTHESNNILGYDERDSKEFFDIWQQQRVKIIVVS